MRNGPSAGIVLADWGQLIWGSGGTFGIAGTLQNAGQTLVVDAGHQWWMMHAVVQGGTIDIAPGTELKYTGTFTAQHDGLTLNDVTVNGTLRDVGQPTTVNGSLKVTANFLLGNTAFVSSPARCQSVPTPA